jgi:predicted nucleic acid-binding protein
MTARCFVDTNVLVYSVDGRFPAKQARARELLSELHVRSTLVLSTQVLQEFFVAATNPHKVAMPDELAETMVRGLLRHEVVPIVPDLVLAGIRRRGTDLVSFWDALIVEAAVAGGCEVLYSEDLQHLRWFGALRVVNPFT